MSWRSRTALMVLGVWGWGISPGWAKPPDLPTQQTVTCQSPPVTETADPGGLTRIGIDFNGFRTDLVVTEAEQESLEPLDLVCPCFWEVLRSYWQSWTLSLMELGSGYPGTRTATPPASETAPTCPYLREHSTQSTPDRTEALPPSGDVLDNLAKLERAQTLWLQAEAARRKGDWDAARDAYGRIQTLCPGSTVAQRATKQLEDLHLKTSVTSQSAPSAAAEEQAPPQSDEPRR